MHMWMITCACGHSHVPPAHVNDVDFLCHLARQQRPWSFAPVCVGTSRVSTSLRMNHSLKWSLAKNQSVEKQKSCFLVRKMKGSHLLQTENYRSPVGYLKQQNHSDCFRFVEDLESCCSCCTVRSLQGRWVCRSDSSEPEQMRLDALSWN